MEKRVYEARQGTRTALTNLGFGFTINDATHPAIDIVKGERVMNTEPQSKAGKRVYFACPMFSAMEKEYALKLTSILERHGYMVFVPFRDGYEAAQLEGKSEQELVQMIFDKDVKEVAKADILFFLLDGRAPDEGACVELGIAYAYQKRCYGFKTDTRTVEMNLNLNPMITGCLIKLFENFDGDLAIAELEEYLSNHDL